jgi:alkylhydroperoxidase family enzyme
MSRVALPRDDEIPPEALERLRSLPAINIYRLLGLVPQCLGPWVDLVAGIYRCAIDVRLREIAICRQARTARASYELHQHRMIAHNSGVTETELRAIMNEAEVTSLDPLANLICRAADEIEVSATLSDGTQERLYAELGRHQATELVVILSFYGAVARFTNATRAEIEVDDPLASATDPSASAATG